MLGLYKLAEPDSIPQILKLAKHESDVFRATAAWLIGECEDPRFLSTLAGMALAGDERVRQNAIRGLTRLKMKIARAVGRNRIRVHLSRLRLLADGTRCSSLAIVADEGRPLKEILATQLVLWEDSRLVAEYGVEQPPRAESLAVAFGLPRASDNAEWQGAVGVAVSECLKRKRDSDLWAIVKYAPNSEAKPARRPVELIWDTNVLETAITDTNPALSVPYGSGPLAAGADAPCGALDSLDLMLRTVAPARGGRAVIFIADPSGGTGANSMDDFRSCVSRLPREARAARTTIHAILPAQAAPLVEEALASICRATDGFLFRASAPEQVPEALMRSYFSCLDRYQLVWRPPTIAEAEAADYLGCPAVRVQIYSEQGYGEDTFPPPGGVQAETA
jgi:hypothetical protein